MEEAAANDAFFDTLPIFAEFEGVADAGNYRPLPDNWALATADIVGSTKAIEEGRYKSVNMAGASVISALLNRPAYRAKLWRTTAPRRRLLGPGGRR